MMKRNEKRKRKVIQRENDNENYDEERVSLQNISEHKIESEEDSNEEST